MNATPRQDADPFRDNCLTAALAYAALGLPVFPLHSVDAQGRCSCSKANCAKPGKHPRTWNGLTNATTNEFEIRQWWARWPDANVAIRTGDRFNVLDSDDGDLGLLEAATLGIDLNALYSTTGDGRHYPFRLPEGITLRNKVKETGQWPLHHCDARGEGGYIVAPPSIHYSGRRYQWSEPFGLAKLPETPPKLLEIWCDPPDDPRNLVDIPDAPSGFDEAEFNDGDAHGEVSAQYYVRKYSQHILQNANAARNPTGFLLALQLRDNGISQESAEPYMRQYQHAVERCRPGKASYTWNEGVESIRQAYSRPARTPSRMKEWVQPMAASAYYGVLGEIVREMEDYIETDSAALLVNMLVMSGITIGRDIFLQHGAGEEHTNLNSVVVAATGQNKSDSHNSLYALLRAIQGLAARAPTISQQVTLTLLPPKEWSGLSTGEGLLYQIRDPRIQKHYDKKTNTATDELVDEGVDDKRLLVVEGEFGAVLTVMYRDGNTLSTTLRLLYDGRDEVRSSPKNNAVVATGAHVGLIAMIPPKELHSKMRTGEVSSGLVNRIMFPLTQRIRSLPHPPDYREIVASHAARWADAAKQARNQREMRWSEEAAQQWSEVYEHLRRGTMKGWPLRTGLAQEALSRVHTWTIRVAMIFAAFDGVNRIAPDHLEAALAVVEYCERCAVYLFGKKDSDPRANKLLKALRDADGRRMTKSDVAKLFAKHLNGQRLDAFLDGVVASGRIHLTKESTSGAPITWVALEGEDGDGDGDYDEEEDDDVDVNVNV